MRTGWEIVIAGRDFFPTEFFHTSRIQPTRIWEREIEEEGERYKLRGIEFSDWHEGPYPLDMVTEALNYLEAHRDEFEKLCRLSGIDERCLNFVDSCAGNFDFASSDISTLASLGFSISICVPQQG